MMKTAVIFSIMLIGLGICDCASAATVGCLEFDGIDDYVEVEYDGNDPFFNWTGEIMIAFWLDVNRFICGLFSSIRLAPHCSYVRRECYTVV